MSEELDDEDWVRRAQLGDREAEHALYVRHVKSVYAVVYRVLQHRADAEDTVQDCFLLAFEKLASLRQAPAFRSWLLRIAVRQVYRRLRRRTWQRHLGLQMAHQPVSEAREIDGEASAQATQLRQLVERLPAKERIAWSLRTFEECTLEEVATLCGCSLATAKRRIAAAQHRLQVQTARGAESHA